MMIVAEAPKAAAQHAILKIPWALVGCDAAGVGERESEVATAPRNLLPRADQTAGHTGNGPLAAPIRGSHVQINAARKIEAALDRRGN